MIKIVNVAMPKPGEWGTFQIDSLPFIHFRFHVFGENVVVEPRAFSENPEERYQDLSSDTKFFQFLQKRIEEFVRDEKEKDKTTSIHDVIFCGKCHTSLINFDVLEQATSKEFGEFVTTTLFERKSEYGAYRNAHLDLGEEEETTLIVVFPADTIVFKHYIQSNTFDKMVLDTFNRKSFYLAHKEVGMIDDYEKEDYDLAYED